MSGPVSPHSFNRITPNTSRSLPNTPAQKTPTPALIVPPLRDPLFSPSSNNYSRFNLPIININHFSLPPSAIEYRHTASLLDGRAQRALTRSASYNHDSRLSPLSSWAEVVAPRPSIRRSSSFPNLNSQAHFIQRQANRAFSENRPPVSQKNCIDSAVVCSGLVGVATGAAAFGVSFVYGLSALPVYGWIALGVIASVCLLFSAGKLIYNIFQKPSSPISPELKEVLISRAGSAPGTGPASGVNRPALGVGQVSEVLVAPRAHDDIPASGAHEAPGARSVLGNVSVAEAAYNFRAAYDLRAYPAPEVAHEDEANLAPEVARDLEANIAPEVAHDLEANIAPEVAHDLEANLAPEVAHDLEANLAPEVVHERRVDPVPEVAHDHRTDPAPEVVAPEAENVILPINPQQNTSDEISKTLDNNAILITSILDLTKKDLSGFDPLDPLKLIKFDVLVRNSYFFINNNGSRASYPTNFKFQLEKYISDKLLSNDTSKIPMEQKAIKGMINGVMTLLEEIDESGVPLINIIDKEMRNLDERYLSSYLNGCEDEWSMVLPPVIQSTADRIQEMLDNEAQNPDGSSIFSVDPEVLHFVFNLVKTNFFSNLKLPDEGCLTVYQQRLEEFYNLLGFTSSNKPSFILDENGDLNPIVGQAIKKTAKAYISNITQSPLITSSPIDSSNGSPTRSRSPSLTYSTSTESAGSSPFSTTSTLSRSSSSACSSGSDAGDSDSDEKKSPNV